MSKNTLIICEKTHNLEIDKFWYNTKNRYWYCLWKGKPKAIHRLLAEQYIPNPQSLGDVHHRDGNRDNNRVDNLQWCTRSDNLRISYRDHGRIGPSLGKFNEKDARSIPVIATCLDTGAKTIYPSLNEAGRQGFQISKVSLCINGKRTKHANHTWKRLIETQEPK